MISLSQLLKEVQEKPKAIFLAGPAGSGKSYTSKQIIPQSYETINSDDTYEELLKVSGIGLKQKDFTPDQLSKASSLQQQAIKATKEKLAQSIENKKNIIIDGTGAASGPVLKKKQQLEDLGYETLMLMIYVSPLTSLQRNQERDRSLMPGIVLRTWRDVNKNIETYKQAFGNNFILLNNNPKDANMNFDKDLLEPYLKSQTAIGKSKTPEQQAKSDAEKEQLNKDIESMVTQTPEFDSIESAKSKINKFINE
jgi:predicted kinase